MFNDFKSHFIESLRLENSSIDVKDAPVGYKELLSDCGGVTFDNGLYHIHTFQESAKWTKLLYAYFPAYDNEIMSFGHDWLGRVYCVPMGSTDCVYMFDPAVLVDHRFEEGLSSFLNGTLASSKEEFLGLDSFRLVQADLGVKSIAPDQCVGFRTPLFLNGKEDMSNCEVSDMEVYWEMNHQLYQQVRDLPEGTRIDKVTLVPGRRSSAEGSKMMSVLCNVILLLVIVLRTYNVYFIDVGNDKSLLVPVSYLGALVFLNMVVLIVLYYMNKGDAIRFQRRNLIFVLIASAVIIGVFAIL